MLGYIRDLKTTGGAVVQYHLELSCGTVHLNPLIGRELSLAATGRKSCVWCGRAVKKLFANGSCFPCFRDLPQNDLCWLKPALCHYETCRDQAWGDANCMAPTYVYLARSSDIKVGISRNLPGRWFDQGAVEALPLALLPTRRLAGRIEQLLSEHLPDKTNWRKMLCGDVETTPLEGVRQRVLALIPTEWRQYLMTAQQPTAVRFPLAEPPAKLVSLNLDKEAVAGRLHGLKGKYLVLCRGVLNVPKYAGYEVEIDYPGEINSV